MFHNPGGHDCIQGGVHTKCKGQTWPIHPKFKDGKCDWVGEYGTYQKHIEVCKNVPLAPRFGTPKDFFQSLFWIHGANGVFTCIYLHEGLILYGKCIGKYSSPMDPMGVSWVCWMLDIRYRDHSYQIE